MNYARINEKMEESTGINYRKLGNDETIHPGDLIVHKDQDDHVTIAEIGGYGDGKYKVGELVRESSHYSHVRRAIYLVDEHDDEDMGCGDVVEELEWAWKNLIQVSDDMTELQSHRNRAEELTGEEFGHASSE